MKLLTKLCLVVSLVFSGMVMASSLSDAKKAGFIGEQFNGYLGVVNSKDPAIVQLVKSTNQKRKARYQQIATKQKTSLAQVEQVAGKKAIAKTLPGNYIKLKGQGWKKK